MMMYRHRTSNLDVRGRNRTAPLSTGLLDISLSLPSGSTVMSVSTTAISCHISAVSMLPCPSMHALIVKSPAILIMSTSFSPNILAVHKSFLFQNSALAITSLSHPAIQRLLQDPLGPVPRLLLSFNVPVSIQHVSS